jgi:hypothetical protein
MAKTAKISLVKESERNNIISKAFRQFSLKNTKPESGKSKLSPYFKRPFD